CAHFNRKSATVKPAFESLKFERHAVVVNSVAAVNARAPICGRIVESDTRAKVVRIAPARAFQERSDKRINLLSAADVLHICVQLVTQAQIQSKMRRDAPVVLSEEGEIVVV